MVSKTNEYHLLNRDNAAENLIRANQEIEDANLRLLLLSEASKLLGKITSIRDVLEAVCRLWIPALGDWCLIFFHGWEKGQEFGVCHHGDPSLERKLRCFSTLKRNVTSKGMGKLFIAKEVEAYSEIGISSSESGISASEILGTHEFQYLKVIQELGMKSALCVPIKDHQKVVASALVVSASDSDYFTRSDVILAAEIANRAGSSIEMAHLLDQTFEAVKIREEFISLAAHELLTPLTSLLLRVQVFKKQCEAGKLDPGRLLNDGKEIEKQTRNLIRLVNGMLDVARDQSIAIIAHKEVVNIGEVVQEVLSAMSYELKEARCALRAEITPDIQVCVDRTRIVQLLTNLLSNAAKFGAGKSVEVKVERKAGGVRISVQDYGIGISQQDQKHIFDRFFRGVNYKNFGGLGLGLYIAAQIARAHDGVLSVKSEEGQGACFILNLPKATDLIPCRK